LDAPGFERRREGEAREGSGAVVLASRLLEGRELEFAPGVDRVAAGVGDEDVGVLAVGVAGKAAIKRWSRAARSSSMPAMSPSGRRRQKMRWRPSSQYQGIQP
jgi:hypothetical protein